MGFQLSDANLKVTKALGADAGTVVSSGIDLGHGAKGDFLAQGELVISAPALTVSQLANAATVKYTIQHDTDAAFGSAATLKADVITQTGAGGAGAVAATKTVRLPVDVNRYVRIQAIQSGTLDASGASYTAEFKV